MDSNDPRDQGVFAKLRLQLRARNKVERAVGRLKQFRRVATRYGKRAVNYLAMVTLAVVLVWL
jgi:transposase